MANIALQLSSQTINTASASSTTSSTLGNFVESNIQILNSYESALSQDFTNFLFGYEAGSYYFPSSQQIIIQTSFATYTLTGPNVETQVLLGLESGSGSVSLTSASYKINATGAVLNETGNVVLTASSAGWYLNGAIENESLTVNQPASTLNGTQDTLSLIGNIIFANGITTSATINSETVTNNGFNNYSNISGNIILISSGSSFSVGGTVSNLSTSFTNGDYFDVTNLNVNANGNFSLRNLPNNGNVLTGTYAGDLTINCGAGNDIIAAGNGPTIINGVNGGGGDVVTFKSISSNYTITPQAGGALVVSSNLTGEGPDTLSNILQLQFTDKTITIAQANSMNEYTTLLYQAALGRPPDVPGLAGWDNIVAALPASAQSLGPYELSDVSGNYNSNLSVAGGFTNSVEFIAKYGSLTNQQFVTQLYANVLDRAPDTAGLNGWLSQLNSGTTREHVLVGFADSVEAISNATLGFTGQSGYHPAWLFLT